jgi:pimeloyl-ACP methyl ester carboxylesterase
MKRRVVLGGAAAVAAGVAVARSRRRTPVATTADQIPITSGHQGGSGTPLLLLHGVGGTWRAWVPVIDELEKAHAVYVPTLPGHAGGEPLADGEPPSIEALTDGVVAEMDRLGLGRVHIVGNSLGGWIALELARRGRASSVVVFSPGGAWYSTRRLKTVAAQLRWGFALMGRLSGRADALVAKPWMRTLLLATQVSHPGQVDKDELATAIRAMGQSPVVVPLLRRIADHPLRPLPDPGCPVRIVWAQQDRVIPFEHFGKPMLERVPSAELVRLPGVGHVPMSDAPSEIARLVLEVTSAVDHTANGQG